MDNSDGYCLEDLFVRSEYRRRGIGKALTSAVARLTAQHSRAFLRWVVLDWNQPAITLYRKLGADFLDEWQALSIAGESLKKRHRHLQTFTSEIPSERSNGEEIEMSLRTIASYFIPVFFSSALLASSAVSQASASKSARGSDDLLHDGQNDFDFDFGTWKTHSSRLLHPLSGSTTWADMDGVTVVKKVWDGRANLAEYKAEGPAGQVELLALRYYNPNAHQWSLIFATPKGGTLSVPCVGEFRSGRGDFYDQEEFNGKYILVRFSIWSITADTAQSEQAFSDDGGKTWEVNWVNKYTRIDGPSYIDWAQDSNQGLPRAHDFDFNVGTWYTHIERVLDPFSDEQHSMEIDGTVVVRKVWGGRAQLEEIEADGPKGHREALSLFLYNPKSQQWSQTFLNSKMGLISASLVGSFKDGQREFVQQDTFNDRSILVRGVWSNITPNTHSYIESYSSDGGKTWKSAFIAHLTRRNN